MKYFVAESVMNENPGVTPRQIEQEYLPQHAAHVHEGVVSGMVLLAGPSATGGFLILRAETREEAEAFLEKDPFRLNDLNRFLLKEFTPKDRADSVKDW